MALSLKNRNEVFGMFRKNTAKKKTRLLPQAWRAFPSLALEGQDSTQRKMKMSGIADENMDGKINEGHYFSYSPRW